MLANVSASKLLPRAKQSMCKARGAENLIVSEAGKWKLRRRCLHSFPTQLDDFKLLCLPDLDLMTRFELLFPGGWRKKTY